MTCPLLLILLNLNNPMDVTEREIRLAIDLASHDLHPGETLRIDDLNSESVKGLLELINEHGKLHAVAVDGVVIMRKMNPSPKLKVKK